MDYSFVENQIRQILSGINSINVTTDNTDVVAHLQSVLNALTTLNASSTSVSTSSTAISSSSSSIASKLPIQKASTIVFSEILSAAIPALTPVKLFSANANRIGFFVYNNSTNSLYGGPTNSPANARCFFQLASNAGPTCMATFMGPTVWTGDIWVIRNAGTGGVTGYELQP